MKKREQDALRKEFFEVGDHASNNVVMKLNISPGTMHPLRRSSSVREPTRRYPLRKGKYSKNSRVVGLSTEVVRRVANDKQRLKSNFKTHLLADA